jgi:F-type H+-transporting ATPase subunit b
MMDKRRTTIAQGLEDARVAAEARANAEREAARIVDEAQVRAQQVIREAEQRATDVAREVQADAERRSAADREKALQQIEDERTRILGEIRSQVAALAIAAAEKLIGTSLDENRQHAILDEFFSGVRGGRLAALQNANISGQEAEVTSALPLTPAEQETVRTDLLHSMGSGASVTFRVDPAILGGLIVRVGDRVVDASVQGQLTGLRESLA